MNQLTGGIFIVDNSFKFAAQIPDKGVGQSGSRCTNCSGKIAYSQHICPNCALPIIGPEGFPQLTQWQKMSPAAKLSTAEKVYRCNGRGRFIGENVAMPLNESELRAVEGLNPHDAIAFTSIHAVSPTDLRNFILHQTQSAK